MGNASLTLVSCWDPTAVVLAPTGIFYCCQCLSIAGIVLVAVLMFLNLSVSVGTINGLLFYVNMVKLNEAFFFPNGSVPVESQFISWLNLDLGIEVCLFDRLDGYWNTWLQFAFPAYLFLLMGGIIVGCHYSVWLCRLLMDEVEQFL